MKLHVLTHLPEDIRRFGPAGLYIIEGFEGWNRIWRLCSILSNHHSPSHDIAIKLCKVEQIKHMLSGGFWRDKDSKAYIQAGEAVRRLFESDGTLRCHLGWSQMPELVPGTFTSMSNSVFFHPDPMTLNVGSVKLIPSKKQPSSCTWDEIFDFDTIPPPHPEGVNTGENLLLGETVVATSGDICRVNSWVFYRSPLVCPLIFQNSNVAHS